MRYLVRIDDVSPYMSRERFTAVRAVLDKCGICPIMGIIPDCRDENIKAPEADRYSQDEYSKLIKDLTAAGWIIAMHGINHVYTTEDPGLLGINPFSEFAGLSYDTQYTKLRQGREILRRLGADTRLFMAPGHSFDLNTLKALKMLGFEAVTDGMAKIPYIREGILFIPCTLVAYNRIKGTDTICLHPNLMDDADIAELESFLKKHRDDAITYDEEMLRKEAVEYNDSIALEEATALKMRKNRDRIANSAKLSAFMTYTDHPVSAVKWGKRILMSPLLLTKVFDKK